MNTLEMIRQKQLREQKLAEARLLIENLNAIETY